MLVPQGGGLFAFGGYQQEAGSSVLFEYCSAKGALAVEDVEECFGFRVSSPRQLCGLIPSDMVLGFRRACRGRQIEAEDLYNLGLAVLERRNAVRL